MDNNQPQYADETLPDPTLLHREVPTQDAQVQGNIPLQPQPQPDATQAQPDAPQGASGARGVLGAVGRVLNRPGHTDYAVDDQGQMQAHPAGKIWVDMLRGAFAGMANAAAAPQHRGAEGMSGLGMGFAGANAQAQQEDSRRYARADENQARAQKMLLQKAQLAKAGADMIGQQYDNTEKAIKVDGTIAGMETAFNARVSSDPRNKNLGVFKTRDELYASHQDQPDLMQKFTEGKILTTPHFTKDDKGQWVSDGISYAEVNPDWMGQKIDKDATLKFFDVDSGKWKDRTVPAFSRTNAQLQVEQQSQEKLALEYVNKRHNDDVENDYKKALAGKARADTAKTNAETKALNVTENPQVDSLGYTVPPTEGGIKEYNKRQNSFKKNADSLAQTEQTFMQFQSILNDIDAGKDITGAQSVVGLFNAIGISAEPLKGKGFRINQATVEEHSQARGLGENLYQKLLKLKSGDIITPQQLKDYAVIASQARRNSYVTVVNEAHNDGLKADFLLPTGNGKKIDSGTAQIFMDLTGGDPAKARTAAQKKGWVF